MLVGGQKIKMIKNFKAQKTKRAESFNSLDFF